LGDSTAEEMLVFSPVRNVNRWHDNGLGSLRHESVTEMVAEIYPYFQHDKLPDFGRESLWFL
jgi:hypothetical protein